jgi:hypothetical protein
MAAIATSKDDLAEPTNIITASSSTTTSTSVSNNATKSQDKATESLNVEEETKLSSIFATNKTTDTSIQYVMGQFDYHPEEAQMPGRAATCTDKEKDALEAFRKLLDPLDIAKIKMPHEDDDKCLLRVLRADDFDIKLCLEKWDNTVKWRNENQIFEKMAVSATEMVFGDRVKLEDILQKYPFGIKGVDLRGRPISFKLAGKIDHSIFDEVDVANIVKWEAIVASKTCYYLLPKATIESGYHVENYIQIIDLDGMGVTSFSGNLKLAIKNSIKLCGEHYPETMGGTFVVNAPWYFRTVWAVVKSFMEPETAKKVRVCGTTSELVKYISEDMLPIEYGGTGKLGLNSIAELYTPTACWNLEQGRPSSWGPDLFSGSDSRLIDGGGNCRRSTSKQSMKL